MVAIVARHWWADTTRHTLLLLLVSEGLTLALIFFARRASHRDLSAAAMVSTVLASDLLPLVRLCRHRTLHS
jgi:hypothetical protein